MKIKVTNKSVELKLTLEDVDKLIAITDTASANKYAYLNTLDHAAITGRELRNAKSAAEKLNWMNRVEHEN